MAGWTDLYVRINGGYGSNKETGASNCTNRAGIVGGPGCGRRAASGSNK
jgi:hypothetical protein